MKTSDLIHLEQLCIHLQVDTSFIRSLHDLGLIELVVADNGDYISKEQLKSLETMIYFHTELDINLEGIDAIAHLLRKIENLQNELVKADSKLSLLADDQNNRPNS